MCDQGVKKLGSPIQSKFGLGECDICVTAVMQEINLDVREDFPHWFAEEGIGNLLSEHMDTCVRKYRSELLKRVKKERVWQGVCGFCDEPFGVCDSHLTAILQNLRRQE